MFIIAPEECEQGTPSSSRQTDMFSPNLHSRGLKKTQELIASWHNVQAYA